MALDATGGALIGIAFVEASFSKRRSILRLTLSAAQAKSILDRQPTTRASITAPVLELRHAPSLRQHGNGTTYVPT
jgi:hypothetical protein